MEYRLASSRRHLPSLLRGLLSPLGLSVFLCALVVAVPHACADNWNQFLGATRDGKSAESGLVDEIPATGLPVLWTVAAGAGQSGVAIRGNELFTVDQGASSQKLRCLDAATGETRWETELAPAYKNSMGDGPRATPTVTQSVVYSYTGDGILTASRRDNGQEIWAVDVPGRLSTEAAEYGMASSPLVVGDTVVVVAGTNRDGGGATLVGFDARSGTTSWTAGAEPAGYSSPTLLNLAGRSQVVAFAGTAALGVDPANGNLLWRYPFKTEYFCNTASPIAIDGDLFLSAGENHGCVRLSLAPDGDQFTVSEKWSDIGPKAVLRNEWQTSLLHQGKLFGFDNVGSAGAVTHLSCVDADSGELVWRENRFGKGNATLAGQTLWITTFQGELVAVDASPDGFVQRGRQQVLGATRQAPAIAGGRMYVRDGKKIVCLDLRP